MCEGDHVGVYYVCRAHCMSLGHIKVVGGVYHGVSYEGAM